MSLDSNAERDAFVAEERAAHKAWIASGLSRDLGAYNCFVEGWHARARSQPSEWVAKVPIEAAWEALAVVVRDYKAVHGEGDLEMQPALEWAMRVLEAK